MNQFPGGFQPTQRFPPADMGMSIDGILRGSVNHYASVRWFNKRLPSFLLDLLEDPSGKYKPLLSWIQYDPERGIDSLLPSALSLSNDKIPTGHFILLQPDKVAQLWGVRTQNFTMNYDKFARAMRHYYANIKINSNDGVIRKIAGANYTYEFTKFEEYLYSFETGSRTHRLYSLVNLKMTNAGQPSLPPVSETLPGMNTMLQSMASAAMTPQNGQMGSMPRPPPLNIVGGGMPGTGNMPGPSAPAGPGMPVNFHGMAANALAVHNAHMINSQIGMPSPQFTPSPNMIPLNMPMLGTQFGPMNRLGMPTVHNVVQMQQPGSRVTAASSVSTSSTIGVGENRKRPVDVDSASVKTDTTEPKSMKQDPIIPQSNPGKSTTITTPTSSIHEPLPQPATSSNTTPVSGTSSITTNTHQPDTSRPSTAPLLQTNNLDPQNGPSQTMSNTIVDLTKETINNSSLLDYRTLRLSYTKMVMGLLESQKINSETADKLLHDYWLNDQRNGRVVKS